MKANLQVASVNIDCVGSESVNKNVVVGLLERGRIRPRGVRARIVPAAAGRAGQVHPRGGGRAGGQARRQRRQRGQRQAGVRHCRPCHRYHPL